MDDELIRKFSKVTLIGSKISSVTGGGIIIIYFLKLIHIKNPIKKVKFIYQNEIKYLKICGLLFVTSLMLLFDNVLAFQFEAEAGQRILFFSSVISATLIFIFIYYGIYSILDFYYPNILRKRLKKIS